MNGTYGGESLTRNRNANIMWCSFRNVGGKHCLESCAGTWAWCCANWRGFLSTENMKATAADILVDSIHDWGVEVVFGLPGDGINGIMEALRKRQDKIRFIQVRHEESAASMACAYSKYTRKLGCCLATSGPGGIHLLNGLYDAKMDSAPVLAITGMHYHDLIGTMAQQEVELDKLFQDVAVFNQRVMSPEHVENLADFACRTALSYRQVAHITFPTDLQA